MKTINANTKQGQRFVEGYNRSRYYDLSDCYGRYSWEKERAQAECREMMRKDGGEGFKIIGFNTCQFSCGWRTPEGLRVETACNSYLVV